MIQDFMRITDLLCMKIFKTRKEREEAKAAKEIERLKKITRTPDVVGGEYAKLASEAGHKAYEVTVLQADIQELNQRMFKLNREFREAQIVHAPVGDVTPAKPVDEAPEAALNAIAQIPPIPLEHQPDVQ